MGLFRWLSELFHPEHSALPSPMDTGDFGAFSVNPASGLPMMEGSMLDVGGNALGMGPAGGINPATGLPLIGDSMIDVAGNPNGTDLAQDHFSIDHQQQDLWSWTSSEWHSSSEW